MTERHVDHPGEVTWFNSHAPAKILGPCPHTDCHHTNILVIADGPTLELYELVECHVPATEDGCDGTCRRWEGEIDEKTAAREHRPRITTKPWQHTDTPADHTTRAATRDIHNPGWTTIAQIPIT